ncbi:hypothetical protein Cadr_000018506 [Camelus dromedarius]|uniref:Uncharacterized protein n=1 Tax=Camelus dromedarius TaxID=9838 RepID=A0A5N4D5G3_CAMDR|nr:hypothetical protein Cadr_000018506 [Camelus dromedarius]
MRTLGAMHASAALLTSPRWFWQSRSGSPPPTPARPPSGSHSSPLCADDTLHGLLGSQQQARPSLSGQVPPAHTRVHAHTDMHTLPSPRCVTSWNPGYLPGGVLRKVGRVGRTACAKAWLRKSGTEGVREQGRERKEARAGARRASQGAGSIRFPSENGCRWAEEPGSWSSGCGGGVEMGAQRSGCWRVQEVLLTGRALRCLSTELHCLHTLVLESALESKTSYRKLLWEVCGGRAGQTRQAGEELVYAEQPRGWRIRRCCAGSIRTGGVQSQNHATTDCPAPPEATLSQSPHVSRMAPHQPPRNLGSPCTLPLPEAQHPTESAGPLNLSPRSRPPATGTPLSPRVQRPPPTARADEACGPPGPDPPRLWSSLAACTSRARVRGSAWLRGFTGGPSALNLARHLGWHRTLSCLLPRRLDGSRPPSVILSSPAHPPADHEDGAWSLKLETGMTRKRGYRLADSRYQNGAEVKGNCLLAGLRCPPPPTELGTHPSCSHPLPRLEPDPEPEDRAGEEVRERLGDELSHGGDPPSPRTSQKEEPEQMGTRKQSRRGNTLEKPFLNISELKTDLSLQTGEVPLLTRPHGISGRQAEASDPNGFQGKCELRRRTPPTADLSSHTGCSHKCRRAPGPTSSQTTEHSPSPERTTEGRHTNKQTWAPRRTEEGNGECETRGRCGTCQEHRLPERTALVTRKHTALTPQTPFLGFRSETREPAAAAQGGHREGATFPCFPGWTTATACKLKQEPQEENQNVARAGRSGREGLGEAGQWVLFKDGGSSPGVTRGRRNPSTGLPEAALPPPTAPAGLAAGREPGPGASVPAFILSKKGRFLFAAKPVSLCASTVTGLPSGEGPQGGAGEVGPQSLHLRKEGAGEMPRAEQLSRASSLGHDAPCCPGAPGRSRPRSSGVLTRPLERGPLTMGPSPSHCHTKAPGTTGSPGLAVCPWADNPLSLAFPTCRVGRASGGRPRPWYKVWGPEQQAHHCSHPSPRLHLCCDRGQERTVRVPGHLPCEKLSLQVTKGSPGLSRALRPLGGDPRQAHSPARRLRTHLQRGFWSPRQLQARAPGQASGGQGDPPSPTPTSSPLYGSQVLLDDPSAGWPLPLARAQDLRAHPDWRAALGEQERAGGSQQDLVGSCWKTCVTRPKKDPEILPKGGLAGWRHGDIRGGGSDTGRCVGGVSWGGNAGRGRPLEQGATHLSAGSEPEARNTGRPAFPPRLWENQFQSPSSFWGRPASPGCGRVPPASASSSHAASFLSTATYTDEIAPWGQRSTLGEPLSLRSPWGDVRLVDGFLGHHSPSWMSSSGRGSGTDPEGGPQAGLLGEAAGAPRADTSFPSLPPCHPRRSPAKKEDLRGPGKMPPPAKGGGKVSGRGSTDRGQTDRHAPPSILLTIQPSQQPPPAPPDTRRPVLGDQEATTQPPSPPPAWPGVWCPGNKIRLGRKEEVLLPVVACRGSEQLWADTPTPHTPPAGGPPLPARVRAPLGLDLCPGSITSCTDLNLS